MTTFDCILVLHACRPAAPAWSLHTSLNGSSTRLFRTGASALAQVKIEVPSMGDSITEGTVSEVKKQAGAAPQRLSKFRSVSLILPTPCTGYETCDGLGCPDPSTPVHAAGDVVASDELIAIIETDKVSIDVRFTGSNPGVMTEVSLEEEQTVTVGQVVGIVDDDPDKVAAAGGVPDAQPAAAPAAPAAAAPAAEVRVAAARPAFYSSGTSLGCLPVALEHTAVLR